MPSISLTPYTIRVKERLTRKAPYLPICKFDGKTSIFDVFDEAILSGSKSFPQNPMRSFNPRTEKSDVFYRDGWLEIGTRGFGSRFQNQEGAEVFRRKLDHTEFIPLFFSNSVRR